MGTGVDPDTGAPVMPDFGKLFGVLGLTLVGSFLAIMVTFAVAIACNHVAVSVAAGLQPRLGAALGLAVRRVFPLIGWQILAGLIILVGICACVLPAIYLSAVFMLLPAVVTFERGGSAISRCFKLFHQDLGASISRIATIAGIGIGIGVVAYIINMLIQLVPGQPTFDPRVVEPVRRCRLQLHRRDRDRHRAGGAAGPGRCGAHRAADADRVRGPAGPGRADHHGEPGERGRPGTRVPAAAVRRGSPCSRRPAGPVRAGLGLDAAEPLTSQSPAKILKKWDIAGGELLVAGGLAVLGLPACSVAGDETADDGSGKVEVFSWWAGPGEKEGLEALVADFRQRNPGIEFDNAAVAGGAGTIARTVLATRLENDDPPDSYQAHAGLELDSDIEAGYVEDVRYLYDQQRWRDRLPKGLVEALTFDGKIYSVPVNIHRANLLWYNPAVLKAHGLTPPASWSQFLTQAATLKAEGILPLSIGPAWTQKHLLECVLLGELGADGYTGLWNGTTDWKGAPVQEALTLFVKVLDQSDIATAAGDWQPALDKVVAGTAAYNVMGDWADAYLRTKGLVFQEGYSVVASPGSEKVYDFLSDSFTLPRGRRTGGPRSSG